MDAAYDQIRQEVTAHDFVEVKRLIDDFYRVHRFPMVRGRGDIELALRQLYHDGEIGYKGLKKIYLWPRDGDPIATETLSIARAELLQKEEEETRLPVEADLKPEDLIGTRDAPSDTEESRPVEVLKDAPEESISIIGLAPLELQEIGPDDLIAEAIVEIDPRHLPMRKHQFQQLVERLPAGMALRLKLKVLRHG